MDFVDSVESPVGTQNKGTIDGRRRGQHRSVELVHSEPLELLATCNHGCCSVAFEEIDASVGVQRRGPEALPDTLGPMRRTRLGIDARGDTSIRHIIESARMNPELV